MKKNIKSFGFTLIELLVVVSIIAMIASIILSALGTAKQKAQDTAKVRELQEVRTALQMYFGDNGSYPNNLSDLTSGSKKYIASISGDIKYATTTNSYHMGVVLKDASQVPSGDKDDPTKFPGNSNNCATTGTTPDLCYDITP